MFEQNFLFENLDFSNLGSITFDKAIEELDKVNRHAAPICSTPKGEYSTTITTFANAFSFPPQLSQYKSVLSLNEPNTEEKKLNEA